MNYGRVRIGRALFGVAVGTAVLLFAPFVEDVPILARLVFAYVPLLWFLGVAFRLYDLRILGLRRVQRGWFMNSRTWVYDFALRGYSHFEGDEPLVH